MNKINTLTNFYQYHLTRIFGILLISFLTLAVASLLVERVKTNSQKPLAISEESIPTIHSIKAYNAFTEQTVTVVAEVNNSKHQTLSYTWQQTSGPRVKFQATNNRLKFKAPSLAEKTSISFSLLVENSAQETAQRTVSFYINDSEQIPNKPHLYLAILICSLLSLVLELLGRRKRESI
ncbi:PKD domain-containing protein [Thalassotalea sediminis]|uniref:PKD domain-containing protein n=1 Tax=Thalassotalea sediminis TaxID=1759089 RepID=UPI0025738E85|nr:hypothetical protein [Thalassotalea sediminis]